MPTTSTLIPKITLNNGARIPQLGNGRSRCSPTAT